MIFRIFAVLFSRIGHFQFSFSIVKHIEPVLIIRIFEDGNFAEDRATEICENYIPQKFVRIYSMYVCIVSKSSYLIKCMQALYDFSGTLSLLHDECMHVYSYLYAQCMCSYKEMISYSVCAMTYQVCESLLLFPMHYKPPNHHNTG